MTQYVLTAVGADRSGLVHTLAHAVAEAGGNWLDSRMTKVASCFAGIVLVDLGADGRQHLESTLETLRREGLEVTVTETTPALSTDQNVLSVRLLGHDHPGIVRDLTATLADLGVTLDEVTTRLREAPMGDGVLFEAEALCRVEGATTREDLREALESVAAELVVEIDLVDRT